MPPITKIQNWPIKMMVNVTATRNTDRGFLVLVEKRAANHPDGPLWTVGLWFEGDDDLSLAEDATDSTKATKLFMARSKRGY